MQAEVIIIGAGAAGLMCAIEAAKRGRKVLLLDHANRVGKKILMSGGGRCNFTNYHISPERYLSHNPHFCKSALSRYTQWDFINWVKAHHIPYHEKTLGQLFCDDSAKDIVNMLLLESERARVEIKLHTKVEKIVRKDNNHFIVTTLEGNYLCESLVIASGGLSIPTMGASPFGYHIAEQFGIKVWPTRAGLVPLTWQPADKECFVGLSGISTPASVHVSDINFNENILFTHRGLSGPAILQISSYWQSGETLMIKLLPELDLALVLKNTKQTHPKKTLMQVLSDYFPKRLLELFINNLLINQLANLSDKELEEVAGCLQEWRLKPNGTEGYRTAEVTLGGVDCDAISSKTMEAKTVPGLFFIGEVVDVTGWLGGYNFQWAWSSGWAAGQVV